MAYNAGIPNANDIPSQSQPQLFDNFQGINTLINVNHIGFDLTDQGKHKWVSMPQQGSDPSTTSSEVAIYGAVDADTTLIELTFRRPTDGTIIHATAKANGADGWTMLPSGILMKWATVNLTGANTINANTFGKAFTTLFSVQLTNQTTTSSSNTYVMGGTISGTSFNVYVANRTSPGTPATANINWLVIGV